MTVPGTVAEVGTSNSTEYALLTNGSLYAWGLGTQGQLGDGRRANSFAQPVQVRFPAGVRIASIPADVMPYDTGLAVDTQGKRLGLGRQRRRRALPGQYPDLPHPGQAPAHRGHRPGRGQ